MEQYSCNLCATRYGSNKSLLRHIRCKHPVGVVKEFACALCEYSTPRADNMKQHVDRVHRTVQEKVEKYCCNLCSGIFGCNKSLNRHIRSKHPVGDQKYMCASCGYCTPRADTLKQHERTAHTTERETKVQCALCEFSSPRRNGMLQHYRLVHVLTIREENHDFCSEGDFYKWKEQVEKDTFSQFVHERRQYVSVPDKSRKLYLKCHRDGIYKPRGSNVRPPKMLGSNKIGGHCPSRMDVTIYSSGNVKVNYCSTHVGHESEICRLRLSKSEREEIAKTILGIMQCHKSSLQLAPEHIICGDGEWQVSSATNKQTTYVVKKLLDSPCKCELRCTDCKACIHEYICSCADSAIKFNMCKHIHLICRYTDAEVSRESESAGTDFVACEEEADSSDNQSLPGESRQCATKGHSREQLLQQFNLCLDVAKSVEAKEVVSKCLSSLLPTLQAMESRTTSPPLSLSKVSESEPQKRFVSTKRKREVTRLPITKPDTSE